MVDAGEAASVGDVLTHAAARETALPLPGSLGVASQVMQRQGSKGLSALSRRPGMLLWCSLAGESQHALSCTLGAVHSLKSHFVISFPWG